MSHNVPEGVAYGTVHGEFMSFAADRAGTADGQDGVPDKIPMEGYVVITPKVETVRWPSLVPPITAVIQDVRCPLIEGRLYPPGTTPESAASVTPGVVLVATEQPEALPSTVQYTLTFDLRGIKRQPPAVTFNVPASGVVDLTTVLPAATDPGVVVVVSTVDRERAEAAADVAEGFAGDAETMRDEIKLWLDSANGAHPIFDPATSEYTTESIQQFLAAYRDSLIYGIQVPKSAATVCTKTGANAGIANPVPGIIGTPAVDSYVKRGPFLTVECNAWVDVDGWPHVTAIQGDPTFSRVQSRLRCPLVGSWI